jgi:hypothetical protein
MKRGLVLFLFVVVLSSFVLAEDFTLTDSDPSVNVKVDGESYDVELVGASDGDATLKVSQTKEITEGSSKELDGLTLKVASADETNFELSADIIVEEKEDSNVDGQELSFSSSGLIKDKVAVNGEIYEVEFLGASTGTATIRLSDSDGGSQTKEIGGGQTKEVNGIMISVIEARESNFELTATILVEKGREVLSLNNSNSEESFKALGESYKAKLIGASDTASTLKVSQTKEIGEGKTDKIGGLDITVKNADETNFALSTTVSIGGVSPEPEPPLVDPDSLSLTNDDPKRDVVIEGSSYSVELVGASDGAATIRVTDSDGESEAREVGEGKHKMILDLLIRMKTADEVNFALSATFEIFKIIDISDGERLILTNDGPDKAIRFLDDLYVVELVSAVDDGATIRVTNPSGESKTWEMSVSDQPRDVNGIVIDLIDARETNFELTATIVIKEIRDEPEIKPPEDKPVEIPKNVREPEQVCNGCVLEEMCYPFGYRKSGEFCSESKEFTVQLESGIVCENSFQCDSNVCVSGECVSQKLIQKIINWFKKLFGAD